MTLGELRARLRSHPVVADAIVAGALFLLALLPDPDRPPDSPPLTLPAVVLIALTCAALVGRSRRPLPVLALTTAGSAVATYLLGGRTLVAVAALLALYTVAVGRDRRTTTIAWATTAAALTLASLLSASRSTLDPEVLAYPAWTGMAAALGDALRNRRAYVAAVEERAVRAEQTREEEARRRVAEERLRIARELHDVIAHRIAVVHVQAGVASHLLTSQPEAAREALAHVRRAGSQILDELSGILDVLRQPDEASDPTAPAPGLDQLEGLVASFAAAGLEVDWSLTGRPRAAGAAVDLVAYRVLEEALTNAHKHGTGHAQVSIDYRGVDDSRPEVALRVSNTVRNAERTYQAVAVADRGHGLVGMRERAAAVGGDLRAAPDPDGQFRVEAVLPLHARSAS